MTTDEQHENQEPMIANNTNDIGKIKKPLKEVYSSCTENDLSK